MRQYSDYTEQYVQEICDALNETGVFKKSFLAENYETLTYFLQSDVVMPLRTFTFLNEKGLVNRGRCPYTGKQINSSFPKWTYMNSRSVYVSHEGYEIMKQEDNEEHERLMGKPRKANQEKSGGGYITIQRMLTFSVKGIILYGLASLISWNTSFYEWNQISKWGFLLLLAFTTTDTFLLTKTR